MGIKKRKEKFGISIATLGGGRTVIDKKFKTKKDAVIFKDKLVDVRKEAKGLRKKKLLTFNPRVVKKRRGK